MHFDLRHEAHNRHHVYGPSFYLPHNANLSLVNAPVEHRRLYTINYAEGVYLLLSLMNLNQI